MSGRSDSFINTFATKRYLEINSREDLVNKLVQNIRSGTRKELTYKYLTILGLIGKKDALPAIYSFYSKCEKNDKTGRCETIQHFSILAIGLIGSDSSEKFLK